MIIPRGLPLRLRSAGRLLAQGPISSRRRNITSDGHKVPVLDPYGEVFERDGIQQMLSPDGFDLAWTQNQGRLVQRLNDFTVGTPLYSTTTKSVLLQTARNPDYAAIFNYASLAHNNHFFFSTLSPTMTEPSSAFARIIGEAFSSFETLQSTFLATANAMFGPGFVWLIAKNDVTERQTDRLGILATYIAGSPYPAAHFRAQGQDMATANAAPGQGRAPAGYAGIFGKYTKNAKMVPQGGQDLTVLMCVSTWEHVYLRDFGVGGRASYLEAWWSCIDWDAVERNMMAEPGPRPASPRGYGSMY